MNPTKLRNIAVAATSLTLTPVAAQAHLLVTGMGPLYDGVLHFGFSPEDFLPVIVFGLFAGLRGARPSRMSLVTLAAAWLAGGVAAMFGFVIPQIGLSLTTAALFISIGVLLAANLELSDGACALVAAVLGVVRGTAGLLGVLFSLAHLLTLLGMCATVFAVFAMATSVTRPLHRAWMIIAARVSGSWLAAVGLLLAGWIARYGAVVG